MGRHTEHYGAYVSHMPNDSHTRAQLLFSELLVWTSSPLSLQHCLQQAVAQLTTSMYESCT